MNETTTERRPGGWSRLVLVVVAIIVGGLIPWHADALARLAPSVRETATRLSVPLAAPLSGEVEPLDWPTLARREPRLAQLGAPVALEGFAVVVRSEAGRPVRLLLVPSAFSCCFGRVPDVDQMVLVDAPSGAPSAARLRVVGQLHVREVRDPRGVLISLYQLSAQRIDARR